MLVMKTKSFLLIFIMALSFDLYALEYKTYLFSDLSKQLGYPSETFFGSTQDQINDLESYTSKYDSFYREINNYLRFYPEPYEWDGTGPADAKIIVSHMDSIFKKVPALPKDLILFRGVDLKYRKNKSFSIGEEFLDKGFFSTSTSFKVAKYFAAEMDIEKRTETKKAIYVIYQNQNSPNEKGILIDQNEDEVILKHGQVLKVMAFKKSNTVYETYLIQLCSLKCNLQLNSDVQKFWKRFQETSETIIK